MSQIRTCLACGREASDVAMSLVEYDAPVEVTIMQPVSFRENAIEVPVQVPGRFGAEWRCRDRAACRARAEDLEPARSVQGADPAAAGQSSEEVSTWFD